MPPTRAELDAIAAEIAELESFRDLAQEITENAKGQALLIALRTAFDRASKLGTARKAVIFTESRRTQEYLTRLLSSSGYAESIVRFSVTNSDPESTAIYQRWRARNAGSDRVTGSRAVDIRAALADEFRSAAQIMIATEAAAEGINLQFCSIVVNYDLPWNPQRVKTPYSHVEHVGLIWPRWRSRSRWQVDDFVATLGGEETGVAVLRQRFRQMCEELPRGRNPASALPP